MKQVIFIIGGGKRLNTLLNALDKDKFSIFLMLDRSKDNSLIVANDYGERVKIVSSYIENFDILICCNTAKIISHEILSRAQIGSLNLHSGPLPEYRGGSPLQWQYLNDEPNYGVSIVEVSKSLDSGRVYAYGSFKACETDTFFDLQDKANMLFAELIHEALTNLIENKPLYSVLPEEGRVWIQRNASDSRLRHDSAWVEKFIRHVKLLQSPYPNFFIETDGGKK